MAWIYKNKSGNLIFSNTKPIKRYAYEFDITFECNEINTYTI
jgi:hypothetical protein